LESGLLGVAQFDWQYHGYNGTAPKQFPDGAFEELRAVFSVHPEPFTFVARVDSNIKTFEDLVGMRVTLVILVLVREALWKL
jgi:TRAP-type uncharacterized transport system substrate-binding protein